MTKDYFVVGLNSVWLESELQIQINSVLSSINRTLFTDEVAQRWLY